MVHPKHTLEKKILFPSSVLWSFFVFVLSFCLIFFGKYDGENELIKKSSFSSDSIDDDDGADDDDDDDGWKVHEGIKW